MKKLICTLTAIFAMLFMTSCSAVQVNERMFVQLMGISENDGIYNLTVQVYSGAGDSDEPEYKTYSGSGRSIGEASDMIMRQSGRQLFFGHCGALYLNESVIRDCEKLKALAGERVSAGCPVFFSDSPDKAVSEADANSAASIAEHYRNEGLAERADLKTVTAAANSGNAVVVPIWDKSISGAAVITSETVSRLSISEAAALNLLRGAEGIRLSVLGGSVTLENDEKSSVYYQSKENGGEYVLELSLKCRIDETGTSDYSEDYMREAERIISVSSEEICRRGISEGFFSEVIAPKYYKADEDNISFTVKVSAKEKTTK